MSSLTRLDTDKLRIRRIVATASISVVAIAFLLLNDALAPGSAPWAGPAGQALEGAANPAEAAQAPPEQPPALEAYRVADDPAPEQSSLSEPGVGAEAEPASPAVTEQRVFKSRRALETIDPRDFLRQSALPK